MSYSVTLEKLSDNQNALRTRSVLGITTGLPCPGQSFDLISASLTAENNMRLITTSLVKSASFVAEKGKVVACDFTTASGTQYRLTVHGEMDQAQT